MEENQQKNQNSVPQTSPQPAGFWVRFFAFLMDSLIISLIVISLFFTLRLSSQNLSFQKIFTPLSFVVSFFYLFIFWVKEGATPGKKIFGLKILKENYKNIEEGLTPSTALARYIGYLLSQMFFFLGFLWVGLDKNKKGWHDKIAGTIVVKIDNRKKIGLRILVLVAYLLFLIGFGIWIIFEEKQIGSIIIKKLISDQEEDLRFNFTKQKEAYMAKLPDEAKKLVEKSRNLTIEAQNLIGGASCELQILNKEIEKKLEEAVEMAKKAKELAPNNPYTYYNLGYVYNWALCFPFGGNDKALLEYQKAIELDKDFIEARLQLGRIYASFQNYKAAIPHLEYVTQKAPFCGDCWVDLGEAYLRFGAKTKAKETLQTAKSLLKNQKANQQDLLKLETLLDELSRQEK